MPLHPDRIDQIDRAIHRSQTSRHRRREGLLTGRFGGQRRGDRPVTPGTNPDTERQARRRVGQHLIQQRPDPVTISDDPGDASGLDRDHLPVDHRAKQIEMSHQRRSRPTASPRRQTPTGGRLSQHAHLGEIERGARRHHPLHRIGIETALGEQERHRLGVETGCHRDEIVAGRHPQQQPLHHDQPVSVVTTGQCRSARGQHRLIEQRSRH